VGSWLIRGATVVTADETDLVLPQADLLIQGSEIAGLWPRDQTPSGTAAARTLEADGRVLIPGLINTHTHAAMTLLRGYADDMELMPWLQERIWPLEMKLGADDVYWGTMLGIAEMLRGGVTCFNDMYHYFAAAAQAVVDSGIRGVISGVLLGFLPDAEENLTRAVQFAQEWRGAGDGRLVTMLGPHAPYTVPDHLFKKVIAAAKQIGLGVHLHLSETASEVQDSLRDHGVTPVRRMRDLGLFEVAPVLAAHCVHLTNEDLEILVANRVGIAHNPGSNMKLASGVAPVPRLLAAGANVGLGTDGPASNNNLDMIEEMRLAALLHKVSTGDPTVVHAPQALAMATRGGAAALGLGDVVGQIKVGLKADLALLDFRQPHLQPRHDVVSHLVYSARAGDVRTVFVNGEAVMLDGELLTIDEAVVFREVAARVSRLMEQ
jgi:5-methylthioadenosine/S-adenosylhomocysteine deaminase